MSDTIGTRREREGESHLVITRTFRAPIADVWASVTESERLARWFGPWRGDPGSGRVEVRMAFEDDAPWEPYLIEECVEPERLRVRTALDDESQNWTLDLRLSSDGGVTTLEFGQVLTSHVDASDVGPGWEFYLDRLTEAVDTGGTSTIAWGERYTGLSEAYREHFGSAAGA